MDGCEGSYLYKRYQRFIDAYRFIKERSSALSQIPEIYRERIKVGFGLWVERFKPEELKYALHYGLRVSDGYVWLYMSKIKSWSLTPEIEEICKDVSWAIDEARKEQALDKIDIQRCGLKDLFGNE